MASSSDSISFSAMKSKSSPPFILRGDGTGRAPATTQKWGRFPTLDPPP